MKTSSDSLWTLIAAMSAKEKQYFQMHAKTVNTRNHYIDLFAAIAQQSVYDEQALKLKFKETPVGKNFKFYKNYLFEALSKSLYDFQARADSKTNILEGCKIAEIYLQKGLFALCRKQLNKVYKLAEAESFNYVLPYLVYLEIEYAIKADDKLSFQTILTNGFKKIENITALIELDMQILWYALSVVNMFKTKKNENLISADEVVALMNSPALTRNDIALPQKQQRNRLAILGACHSMLSNNVAALNIRKQIIQSYGPVSKIKPDNYKVFLSDFNNYLITLDRVGASTEALEHLDDLLQMVGKNVFNKQAFLYLRYRTYCYVYNLRLNHLLSNNKIDDALHNYNTIKNDLPIWEPFLSDFEKFTFYKYFLLVCLMSNDYKSARNWCYTILEYAPNVDRKDVVAYAKYMLAVCLYETNDRIFLSTYLTKLKKSYRRNGENGVGPVIVKLLQLLLIETDKTKKLVLFQQSLTTLSGIPEQPATQNFNYFYSVSNWIANKIKKP